MHQCSIIVALLLIVTIHNTVSTIVSSCPKGEPKPISLEIEGCVSEPCSVIRGKTAYFHMNFTAPRYTNEMTVKVTAQVPPIDVNYPVQEPNACKGLTNTKCPVEENEPLSYTFSMYILRLFPKVSLNLLFSIIDEQNKVMTCFSVKLNVE